MKKRLYSLICLYSLISIILCACQKQQTGPDTKEGLSPKEPSVVKTYEVSEPAEDDESDDLIVLVKHYEMSDSTWKTDTHTYQHRLEISGRLGGNAAKDSTFVFLSNIEDITFDQAWKASGLSSNTNDYFDEEDAKFVGMK